MNSILAVEKGLPPGLWLPRAEESTEQYLSPEFNHPNHDYERVVDYGSFVIALAVLGAEDSGRTNFMPLEADFVDMYKAGYGLAPHGHLKTAYGGVYPLQIALGFYPAGYRPSRQTLIERFTWMKEYGFPVDQGFDPREIGELAAWGASKNLSVGYENAKQILGGNSTELRRSTGLEKLNLEAYKHEELYRFGAKVIRENGGPLAAREIDAKYPDYFVRLPSTVMDRTFGGFANFWEEFGHISYHAKGWSKDKLLSLGVRWAIQSDGEILSVNRVNDLAGEGKFPSRTPIRRHFGKFSLYRAKLREEYQTYLELQEELELEGVDPEITKLAARLYEPGPSFGNWLRKNIDSLKKLSDQSERAIYVKKLMSEGLDLESEFVYKVQVEDLLTSLRRVGIKGKRATRLVLTIIPRLNPSEIVG